jgi:hypothetical protein
MALKDARFTVLACATLLSVAAFGDEPASRHPLLDDRFVVSAGAYLPQKQLKIRVDGSVPVGDIGFDERFGLSSDETTWAAEFRWRFGEKWSVAGQYFTTSDDGRAVLTEDVSWGDYIVKAGSNVGAGVGLDVARVFFGREFSSGPRHELGLGFGLHWLEISAYLDGEFFVDDESTGYRRESVDAGAPLPNIGGWYRYAFSPRWMLISRLDWLGASVGDYSGDLWNANVGINFQPFRHFGIDLTYQYFKLDIDVSKSDWRGGAGLTYDGPFLALNLNW